MADSYRLRVIAGTARGRTLRVPKGGGVRPTLDRVREALFSIIGPAIEGASFLDLFAGSGANGIEALSRGAAFVQFIDSDPSAIECISENATKAGFERAAVITRAMLPSHLARSVARPAFDYIFADPPYALDAYSEILRIAAEASLVKEGGWLILEHPSKRDVAPMAVAPLVFLRTYRYGESALSAFEHNALDNSET